MKIISPIAIDMGAKNTGVYLNHFEQGEDPTTSGNIAGKTIVIDSSKITWSQAGRTQKRHQVRGNKRRKLAKRLIKVILKSHYELDIEEKQLEFLMGLLNRRGYNRIELTPEQEEVLSTKAVTEFFFPRLFTEPSTGVSLLDGLSDRVIIKNKDNQDYWKSVLKDDVFSLSGKQNKEFKDYLALHDKGKDKDEIADLSKAFTAIKQVIGKQIENYDSGHLHRRDYLENIKKDVQNELLKSLLSGDLTAEKLSFLIGNVSNLQLRVLRKYFNDYGMQSGDKWAPDKLHEFFFKWVRSWHCKQDDERTNQRTLLARKGKDILEVFTTSNPELSIPPYEDQNNRRPPKDMTLRLKPKGLDNKLSNWESITRSLVKSYCMPQTEKNIIEPVCIQKNLKDNVRPQKIKGEVQDTEQRQILADTLHRILDRTIKLDPYKLRWLSEGSKTDEAQKAKEVLNRHSENKADAIIDFAKEYYDEVDIAKQGLWSDSEQSLFFRCNTNPPHKNKIQHNLISHILGENLNEQRLSYFVDDCWNEKIGRLTIKGIAKKTEEERKKYGNRFKHLVQRQVWLNKQGDRELDNERKHGVNGKVILEVHEKCLKATDKIAEYFTHNDRKKKIYANVFSMAQLYNILETNIRGFSKTDNWNTIENAWRSRKDDADEQGEYIANAVRLTADSIRPFDGMLDRIISRQAYEIAGMKIQQIGNLKIDTNDTLFVPIFMEQNRFSFEQSLHEIKGLKNVKKKAKERVEKGLKKQKTQWQNKDDRIKKNKYCPYTGGIIGKGEIDHIIPQSESKKRGDVVFNSEANLIYCSGTGNHTKGNVRWTFEQLHPNYLNEVFAGETNIKQTIIDFVNGLDENDPISFHNLEGKEQNYLRHALFISDLDSKTFPILNTRYKTFVNGTQGYLGKKIRKLLQDKYPNVEIKTYQIPAQEVSQLRKVLGSLDKTSKKQDIQSAFSHVVDASLVLATALQNPKIAEELQSTNVTELSEQGQWLKALLPTHADVQHIERKPKYRKNLSSTQIFKEGLYGERFMPILLDNEKLYYGFSLDNCHEIEPLKQPKNHSKDFDKKVLTVKEKQLVAHNKYFDLLKEFLYTGSSRRKNKKPVTDSMQDNQDKYSYLSIDTIKALNHLQKCAKEVCDTRATEQAKKLEKLRYSVEKKNIKNVLLQGRGRRTFIKQLDDKKFKVSKLTLPAKKDWERLINHPIIDYQGNKVTLKECFDKPEQVEIDNPKMVNFWQDLSQESGFKIEYLKDNLLKKNDKGEFYKQLGIIPKGVFDQKIKTMKLLKPLANSALLEQSFGVEFKTMTDLIPQESWDKLFEEFFHTNKIKNNNFHKQVRKDYSLPEVSAPSGGFRIQRKNSLTNETIYQVSAIADGGYACGFAKKKDGSIDMSKNGVTFNPALKASRRTAYIGKSGKPYIHKESDSTEVESFGSSREVALSSESVLKCRLTLAEASRIDVAITISNDIFKKIIEFSSEDIDVSQPPPDFSIKFTKSNGGREEHDKFKEFLNAMNIPTPREAGNPQRWAYKFEVQASQDTVVLSYRTSMTAELKTAYLNGTLVND